MKTIELTQGQVALVDDEDYERVAAHKWHAWWSESAHSYYAHSSVNVAGKRRQLSMHRLILSAKRGEVVDHVNHDTLDNRRCNLRRCSATRNMQNRQQRRDSRSPYKGVYRQTDKTWVAQISLDGRRRYLGSYATAEAAAYAYDDAARRLHKAYALTNVMLGLIPPEPKGFVRASTLKATKTSRHLGVSLHKNGQWQAAWKGKYLGIRRTEDEAAALVGAYRATLTPASEAP